MFHSNAFSYKTTKRSRCLREHFFFDWYCIFIFIVLLKRYTNSKVCHEIRALFMHFQYPFSTQLTSAHTAPARAFIQPPPPSALPLLGSLPGEECIVGFAGNQCMIPAITFRTMASDILPMLCCKSY